MEASSDGNRQGNNPGVCGGEIEGVRTYLVSGSRENDSSAVGYSAPVDCCDRTNALHANQVRQSGAANNVSNETAGGAANFRIGTGADPLGPNCGCYFHAGYTENQTRAVPFEASSEISPKGNSAPLSPGVNTLHPLSKSLSRLQTNVGDTDDASLCEVLNVIDGGKVDSDIQPHVLSRLISEVKSLCIRAPNRGATSSSHSPGQRECEHDRTPYCQSNTSSEWPGKYYTERRVKPCDPKSTRSDGMLQEFSLEIRTRCLPRTSVRRSNTADAVQDFELKLRCTQGVADGFTENERIPSERAPYVPGQGRSGYNAPEYHGSDYTQDNVRGTLSVNQHQDCAHSKPPEQRLLESASPYQNIGTPISHNARPEGTLETRNDSATCGALHPNGLSVRWHQGLGQNFESYSSTNEQYQTKFAPPNTFEQTSNPHDEYGSDKTLQPETKSYPIPHITIAEDTETYGSSSGPYSYNLLVPEAVSYTTDFDGQPSSQEPAAIETCNEQSETKSRASPILHSQPAILESRFSQNHCSCKCELKTTPLIETFSRSDFSSNQCVKNQECPSLFRGRSDPGSALPTPKVRFRSSQNASKGVQENTARIDVESPAVESEIYKDECGFPNSDESPLGNAKANSGLLASEDASHEPQASVQTKEPNLPTAQDIPDLCRRFESKETISSGPCPLTKTYLKPKKNPERESNATSTEGLTIKSDSKSCSTRDVPCSYGFENMRHFCQSRSISKLGSEPLSLYEVSTNAAVLSTIPFEDERQRRLGSASRITPSRKYAIERVVPDDDQPPSTHDSNTLGIAPTTLTYKPSKSPDANYYQYGGSTHAASCNYDSELEKSSRYTSQRNLTHKEYHPSSIEESCTGGTQLGICLLSEKTTSTETDVMPSLPWKDNTLSDSCRPPIVSDYSRRQLSQTVEIKESMPSSQKIKCEGNSVDLEFRTNTPANVASPSSNGSTCREDTWLSKNLNQSRDSAETGSKAGLGYNIRSDGCNQSFKMSVPLSSEQKAEPLKSEKTSVLSNTIQNSRVEVPSQTQSNRSQRSSVANATKTINQVQSSGGVNGRRSLQIEYLNAGVMSMRKTQLGQVANSSRRVYAAQIPPNGVLNPCLVDASTLLPKLESSGKVDAPQALTDGRSSGAPSTPSQVSSSGKDAPHTLPSKYTKSDRVGAPQALPSGVVSSDKMEVPQPHREIRAVDQQTQKFTSPIRIEPTVPEYRRPCSALQMASTLVDLTARPTNVCFLNSLLGNNQPFTDPSSNRMNPQRTHYGSARCVPYSHQEANPTPNSAQCLNVQAFVPNQQCLTSNELMRTPRQRDCNDTFSAYNRALGFAPVTMPSPRQTVTFNTVPSLQPSSKVSFRTAGKTISIMKNASACQKADGGAFSSEGSATCKPTENIGGLPNSQTLAANTPAFPYGTAPNSRSGLRKPPPGLYQWITPENNCPKKKQQH